MAFNKIQPEQLQMPTFYSDSGDIVFDNTIETGVKANLSRGLTGDFAFTGVLTSNKHPLLKLADTGSNDYDISGVSGSFAINGTSNIVSGENNVCVNGISTVMSGKRNVSINGRNQTFRQNVDDCTALAGRQAYFDIGTTGAVVMTDFKTDLR